MKSYRLFALAAAFMLLASCSSDMAELRCTVEGVPGESLVLKQLNGTIPVVLDTVKTDANGGFTYKLKISSGAPEFVYVYRGDVRLVSLLLAEGDKAEVEADTLGNFSVSGSPESAILKEGDDAYKTFVTNLMALSDGSHTSAEIGKEYVRHYRESVRFVMSNSKSLAVIPVLYENVGGMPTFGTVTDALVFRSVCDSLKSVYPDSKYVKALENETRRRENLFSINNSLGAASEIAYPNLSLPSFDGTTADLDKIAGKQTLVYFWDCANAAQKMFNLDVLKDLYAEYHPRGLEIYAVCVNPDKASWGRIVKDQGLPWVNVNDGLGAASRSLILYNIQQVPACVLVSDSGITPVEAKERPLRSAIAKALK